MFIDYITLLLINMVAGHVLLALYVYAGLGAKNQLRWSPGFGICGLVALVFGGHMVMSWPVPGPFNMAFGEMSVFWGVLFLGASWAMARGVSLVSLGIYAFFAGLAAIVVGAQIMSLGLTKAPGVSGIGFILSGLGGVFAAPTLTIFRNSTAFRMLAALVLLVGAAIWAYTGYMAYAGHMESLGVWVPLVMRS